MNGKTENAEKYIDDIIKDLPDSKYTQRFREELLEHVEDSEKEFKDEEKATASEEIIKKIRTENFTDSKLQRLLS